MRLLLDTQAFLWGLADSPRLGPEVRQRILDADEVLVSLASAWEATFKASLGKLTVPGDFQSAIAAQGYDALPIEFRHIEALAGLQHHHRDPFDRILIAQALCEGLTVVTSDEIFKEYGVSVLAV